MKSRVEMTVGCHRCMRKKKTKLQGIVNVGDRTRNGQRGMLILETEAVVQVTFTSPTH